jgi:hypothetical protein
LRFLNAAFEKGRTIPHEKMPPFAVHAFSRKRDEQPCSEFHMKEVVLFIYRVAPRMLDFPGCITVFGDAPFVHEIEVKSCSGV